jgi:hypothetical protein
MRQKDRDTYVLSSGREFYANGGIIGLSPKERDVYHGYDGNVLYDNGAETSYTDQDSQPWTRDEKLELADYMIDLWSNWLKGV